MEITLTNGLKAEIDEAEAKRIAGLVHNEPHEYLKRAQDNLERLTGKRPESEDDLKHILYMVMPELNREQADTLFEVVEAAIGRFATDSM